VLDTAMNEMPLFAVSRGYAHPQEPA
jgi:hypothetical protein